MDNIKHFEKKSRFSLIDLLMIIMLVGIVFTLTVPVQATKERQNKVKEAVVNLQKISHADKRFKQTEESGGDYAFFFDQLNLDLDAEYFEYSMTDTTYLATSTEEFGTKDVKIHFYRPNGPFFVNEDEISQKKVDNNWLP